MIKEMKAGEQYLAIDKIEPGFVYKLETSGDKCIFVQFLDNKEAVDILTAEKCDHIYPSFEEGYNTNFSIITPFSKRRTIVTLPDNGYVPVVNLTTGEISVIPGAEYNSAIREVSGTGYPLIIAELNHYEVISYGKKLGNLVMLTLPLKNQDDSLSLVWKPVYKDEINGEIKFLKTPEEIKKAYDLKRTEGDIDLEWYYYNWNTISKEEQDEVLAWVSVNDWGFKLANKINRLV